MSKFFIKTDNFMRHHAVQRELYNIGYKWFLNENAIDIGNCGFILIVDDKYATLSMENYFLQPDLIKGFAEVKSLRDIPVLKRNDQS